MIPADSFGVEETSAITHWTTSGLHRRRLWTFLTPDHLHFHLFTLPFFFPVQLPGLFCYRVGRRCTRAEKSAAPLTPCVKKSEHSLFLSTSHLSVTPSERESIHLLMSVASETFNSPDITQTKARRSVARLRRPKPSTL